MKYNNENRFVAIMAGGVGSRFWPSSTEDRPKQFLDILGVGKSLIQLTYERFLPIIPKERILVVTNERYRSITQEHLPDLPPENILCEPSRNNTGPCVAYTAYHLRARNKDAIFVTASSDHVILKEADFCKDVIQAFDFVESQGSIITLGIKPTRPTTGYGYIETKCKCEGEKTDFSVGVCSVESFKEKPDRATAEKYLADGHYLWNAGIFVWKADMLLNEFKKHCPGITDVLGRDVEKFGTGSEQEYINKVYPETPSISVDYAILENSDEVFTISSDIGWSDLGTWNSLHSFLDKDENSTVTLGRNTYLSETSGSLISSDSQKLVVIKGLKDYIVVDEADALLIYPREDEQEIKKVISEINKLKED